MKPLVICGLILVMGSMCRKENKNQPFNGTPACIQLKIVQAKMDDNSNSPTQVNEYLYNGKKVYLFTGGCCDQLNILLDSSCNTLCAPSGGITGKGDGKCPDFNEKATHIRLVWKDTH